MGAQDVDAKTIVRLAKQVLKTAVLERHAPGASHKLQVSYTFSLSDRDSIEPPDALALIDMYLTRGWVYDKYTPMRGDYDVETKRFKHIVYLVKEQDDDLA